MVVMADHSENQHTGRVLVWYGRTSSHQIWLSCKLILCKDSPVSQPRLTASRPSQESRRSRNSDSSCWHSIAYKLLLVWYCSTWCCHRICMRVLDSSHLSYSSMCRHGNRNPWQEREWSCRQSTHWVLVDAYQQPCRNIASEELASPMSSCSTATIRSLRLAWSTCSC